MPSLIFCVEPGILFNQAVLLCESVEKYTGNFFNQKYAFSPRQQHQLICEEKNILKSLNVRIIDKPLNINYLDYPIANKILACLWAEENLTDDMMVMVDTDTIFLQPPLALNTLDGDVFMRPVDRPGQSSLGPASEYENYWQKAYQLCQKNIPENMIRTGVNHKLIRPYFNAGFVAYKRHLKLAKTWLECLDILRTHDHHPNNLRCLDQVALAITTAQFDITVLPDTYNYPIPLRSKMHSNTMQTYQWDTLVHVHYHRWFQKTGFFDLLNPLMQSHDIQNWLLKRLPLEPNIDDTFPH